VFHSVECSRVWHAENTNRRLREAHRVYCWMEKRAPRTLAKILTELC
jgi:hypothetical protein